LTEGVHDHGEGDLYSTGVFERGEVEAERAADVFVVLGEERLAADLVGVKGVDGVVGAVGVGLDLAVAAGDVAVPVAAVAADDGERAATGSVGADVTA
jgi:hypothetical protein